MTLQAFLREEKDANDMRFIRCHKLNQPIASQRVNESSKWESGNKRFNDNDVWRSWRDNEGSSIQTGTRLCRSVDVWVFFMLKKHVCILFSRTETLIETQCVFLIIIVK